MRWPFRKQRPRANRKGGRRRFGVSLSAVSGLLPALGRRLKSVVRAVGHRLGRAMPYAAVALLAALAPLVLAFGYRYVTQAPSFALREVRFSGQRHVPVHELLETAGIDRSPNLLALDPEDVRKRLEEHPWIVAAKVERHLPDRLAVEVLERKPAAILALGALYLVDDRGKVFSRTKPGEHWDFPVMTGLTMDDLDETAGVERLRTAERLVRGGIRLIEVWRQSMSGQGARLSEVSLDPLFGYAIVLGESADPATPSIASGAMIRLGHGGFAAKLARLADVLADARRRGRRVAEVRLDDQRDPGRVAVRFRQDEAPEKPAEPAGGDAEAGQSGKKGKGTGSKGDRPKGDGSKDGTSPDKYEEQGMAERVGRPAGAARRLTKGERSQGGDRGQSR